jgi:hypothetical protein
MNYLRREQAQAPAPPSEEVKLLREIRDALVKPDPPAKRPKTPPPGT